MSTHRFFCIDAHTCGNPVRVVVGGAPALIAGTMSARRQHFMANFDWIRTGLMFEPRGHDIMSGTVLYEPQREDCDLGVLFIETSGCLPMCGHGTIGTVTVALQEGLVYPKTPGILRLDAPAGVIEAAYERADDKTIASVRIRNVASFVYATGVSVDVAGLGPLVMDIAYGGNFYAIIEPQTHYDGLDSLSIFDIQRLSPHIRDLLNKKLTVAHPQDASINRVTHVLWTGRAKSQKADARNAVFYGEKAIDRSPCGTGTSARMAQLVARGDLKVGDHFVHESIIGSLFYGRVEAATKVGSQDAIIPSIKGQAWVTGYNTIVLDDRDPFVKGFTV